MFVVIRLKEQEVAACNRMETLFLFGIKVKKKRLHLSLNYFAESALFKVDCMSAAGILVILTVYWERAAPCPTAICDGLNVVCVLFVQNSVTDQRSKPT